MKQSREVVREYPYRDLVLYEVEERVVITEYPGPEVNPVEREAWLPLVPNYGVGHLQWTDIREAEATAVKHRVKHKRDTRVIEVTHETD